MHHWSYRSRIAALVVTGIFCVFLRLYNPSSSNSKIKKSIGSSTSCDHNSDQSTSHHLLTFLPMGKLGNNMFQFASTLGLAKTNQRTPFIPPTSRLASVFQISYVKSVIPHPSEWRPVIEEKHYARYDKRLNCLPPHKIALQAYLQSYKYFENVKDEIVSEFRFLSNIDRRANNMLGSLFQGRTRPNRTIVGVHVRRGDKLGPNERRKGEQVAPVEYFMKAFARMREKYEDVLFVVTSDEPGWTKSNLKAKDVLFLPYGSADVHLCVMTKCDHIIMSLGTFGWWAGFLAGGDVIYFNNSIVRGSPRYKHFRSKDFFPPNWIGLGS